MQVYKKLIAIQSLDDKAGDDTVDDDTCKKTVQEPASEYDQALKNVLDKMMDQEKEATEQSDAQCDSQLLQEKITRASSTNSFNTISTPVNTASASRTFSPIGPSFVPFGGSFPIDVANPHDPLMPDLEDTAEIRSTGIFGNAYDDHALETLNTPYAHQSVGAEADFNNMEPSTVVEAMQEELLQFKIQKVWTLVNLPSGKKAIDTKWVYRNKKDERGIVVRNKSRLVAQGYKQEECIDYNKVFAPVARVEAIRGDDIIFGSTKKSLCDEFEQIMHNRFQMISMGELIFFLGLQVKKKEDGIFISQDKYVGEILKKFGISSIRTASTPMETNKALTKDEDGEDIDVHLYRSMIGSLMYLTSSRLDIMFSIVTMQVPAWTGNPQQETKIHANNESVICVIKNLVYHSKTKHIEIRHHFIRDSYEKRQTEMVKIHTYNNVADLLTKVFDVGDEAVHKELGDRMERAATTASSLEVEQDS
ncbi:retrotransposon protein, putative, unclassified, partial [Tanacetum coccineum]